MANVKVGIATGPDRRANMEEAAYLIRSETATQLTDNPIIMPRSAPPGEETRRTRAGAILGLLDELRNFHDKEIRFFEWDQITIAASPDEEDWLERLGRDDRVDELPVEVEYLYGRGPWDTIHIFRYDGGMQEIRINRKIHRNKMRLSVSVPSADGAFGVYGALQNMIYAVHPADRSLLQGLPGEARLPDDEALDVAASLLLPDEVRSFSGTPGRYREVHDTLARQANAYRASERDTGRQLRTLYRNFVELAKALMPDLSYVDGTYVIGGTGDDPSHVVDGQFAISGEDPVAVDATLALLLDQDVDNFGHLQYLEANEFGTTDMSNVKEAGVKRRDIDVDFTPHPSEDERLEWRHVRLDDEGEDAVGFILPEEEKEEEEEQTEETEEVPEEESTESSGDTKPEKETTSARAQTDDQKSEEREEPSDATVEEQSTEEDTAEPEPETESGSDQQDGELSVRERVRRRLIKRGKMEGDIPEEDGEGDADTGSRKAEETTEQPQETMESAEADTAAPSSGTTEKEKKEGEYRKREDLSLRERIERRLIMKGKREGELPGGEPEETSPSEAAPAGESAETDQKKEQKEQTVETSEEENQTATAASPEGSETSAGAAEDTSETGFEDPEQRELFKERTRLRMKKKGLFDGDLTGEEEARLEELNKLTEDRRKQPSESSTSAAGEDGEFARGGSINWDEISNLSPEEKVRARMKIRRQSMGKSTDQLTPSIVSETTTGSPAKSTETTKEETTETSTETKEETGGEPSSEPEEKDTPEPPEQEEPEQETEEQDGASTEEAPAEEEEEEEKGEEGYTRDPDKPLRERIKDRLEARGKL